MHPIIFQYGLFQLRFYGLMYVVAILVCRWIARKEFARKQLSISTEQFDNLILVGMVLGVLFGRAYYVAFHWPYYAANPMEIPAVWHGGLAIHGGLLGGFIAALWLTRRWQISFWSFADAMAPSLILGQAFGRFGNFMNGDAHGVPTSLPWGMRFAEGTPATAQFRDAYLHPTMLYEMLINLGIFYALWRLRRRPVKPGFVFSLYLIGYSIGRFWVSFYRADSLMLGSFRAAHVVSLAIICVMGWFILQKRMWTES